MWKEKISGVYKITNLVNNKYYIGSATNIKSRFSTHKRLLESNKHFNGHLQSSFNKYGKSNFKYEIIEVVTSEDLIEREQYWIDKLDANNRVKGYNKRLIAGNNLGIKASDETKEKLRISHLGNKRSPEAQLKITASQNKKVCQFDMNGNYIQTHNSLKEAANSIGVNYASGISACSRKKIPSANGYRWCFENDFVKFKKNCIKKRGWHKRINVEVTCLVTGKVYRFETLTEARKTLKIHSLTLKNKNQNRKYSWKKNTCFS